jgi:hypothetical protein
MVVPLPPEDSATQYGYKVVLELVLAGKIPDKSYVLVVPV